MNTTPRKPKPNILFVKFYLWSSPVTVCTFCCHRESCADQSAGWLLTSQNFCKSFLQQKIIHSSAHLWQKLENECKFKCEKIYFLQSCLCVCVCVCWRGFCGLRWGEKLETDTPTVPLIRLITPETVGKGGKSHFFVLKNDMATLEGYGPLESRYLLFAHNLGQSCLLCASNECRSCLWAECLR